MIFRYTREDLKDLRSAERYRFIQGNGLGGFIACTAAFSVSRCDDGILCSSVQVPNVRKLLVHRLKETLRTAGKDTILSMQRFADGTEEGDGLKLLTSFEVDALPEWKYRSGDVSIRRTCAILYGKNASVVSYEIENASSDAVDLIVDPGFLMNYKGEPVREKGRVFRSEIDNHGHLAGESLSVDTAREGGLPPYNRVIVTMDGFDQAVRICTDGMIDGAEVREDALSYPDDAKDGRSGEGYETHLMEIHWRILPGAKQNASILFTMELWPDKNEESGTNREPEQNNERKLNDRPRQNEWPETCTNILSLLLAEQERREKLVSENKYCDETAKELCRAADLYLSRKEATKGSTLLAGYPLFGDWGRDTMIAIPGCILATGKYREAREIFTTFLQYERNGLVPNLFPEKGQEPMYNSVDAPLLLIEGLKLYVDRCGDWKFIEENYAALADIIRAYREGTDYNIHMDTDFLIEEGVYPWQLTWMDACIDGVLPTPRYGKPVEIGAYWYNALMIMTEFADRCGDLAGIQEYKELAENVKTSFLREFWIPEKGYLKDLVSGKAVDLQIRCNQIWALSLSYTMLNEEQGRQILETVTEYLYTPYGLRTLAPNDPEYKGYYGGPQFERDMAYHQGTIWVYPMGAYYRAMLKVCGYSEKSVAEVQHGLAMIKEMLREGCAGELPEIYDGDTPGESKGCYAQCWSVGEILRVYEELERAAESV